MCWRPAWGPLLGLSVGSGHFSPHPPIAVEQHGFWGGRSCPRLQALFLLAGLKGSLVVSRSAGEEVSGTLPVTCPEGLLHREANCLLRIHGTSHVFKISQQAHCTLC